MTPVKKTNAAFLVQVVDNYGQKKIVAQAVNPQADGELHSFMYERFSDTADVGHLVDLKVTAYLGYSAGTFGGSSAQEKRGEIWGLGRSYEPHHIEHAEQAKAMGATLSKIDKGLQRINESAGHLGDGEYAGYLLRIATILRVPTIYVRNTVRARNMSGETYRKVNGSALQWWVSEVSQVADKSDWVQLGFRG